MKKLLFSIFLVLVLVLQCHATDYFGCAGAAVNADNTFCATPSGSCAGSDPVNAATALQVGNNLYANGCTITIPNGGSFTATKISTADGDGAGAAVAGGGFTATANGVTATITANVGDVGGTTDVLTIGSSANVVSISILGDITTGATAGADGVSITGSAATVTIGAEGSPVTIQGGGAANSAVIDSSITTTKAVYANITAGNAANAYGYQITGASGTTNIYGAQSGGSGALTVGVVKTGASTVNIIGSVTGGSGSNAYGAQNSSATVAINVTGSCSGAMPPYYASGCVSLAAGGISVVGDINDTETASGKQGKVSWAPSTNAQYVKVLGPGSPAFWYMARNPDVAVTDVRAGTTYGWDGSAVYTGTMSTGGSAWAQ